jgi:putative intracellular protease/amidase
VIAATQSWNKPTIEEGAAAAGATYVSPAGPWDAFTVVDGRLVTGVNPQSATKTAEDAVEAFNKL